MQKGLRRKEDLFCALIQQSVDAFILMTDDGSITYASPATEALLGYSADTLVGMDMFHLIHEEDLATINARLRELLNHPREFISVEFRCRHSNGTWRWLEGTVRNALEEPAIEALVGSYRDCTERKQAEKQRQLNEERYHILVEEAADGIFVSDLQGNYIEANMAVCAMSGYSREELLRTGLKDLAFKEDRAKLATALERLLTGETTRIRWRLVHKDGHSIHVGLNAKLLSTGQVLGVLRDISAFSQTEEKLNGLLAQAEAAKAQAETAWAQLHDLFMQAPANIAIITGPEHRFILANPRFLQNTGRQNILNKTTAEVLPETINQGFGALMDEVRRTGKPFVGNEMPIRLDVHGNGTLEERFYNFVYQPFRNIHGEVEGVMIHGVDVTEQVTARRRVEELVIQLQQEREASRQAEQEAARQASQLRAIFETMTDGVMVFDREGNILQVNAAIREFITPEAELSAASGYTGWSMPHDPQGVLLTPEQWPLTRILKGETLSGNNTVDVLFYLPNAERLFYNATGAPMYDKAGQIAGGIMVLRDMTERFYLGQQLQYSERKLRSLVEANIFGVGVLDIQGPWREVNDCLAQMLGYQKDELLDDTFHWRHLTPPELREQELEAIRTLPSTRILLPREREYIRKDGSRFPSLMAATMIDQERGLALLVILDISDRKAAEQRKQEFLSMVSHELRTPLTGIIGYLDLAQFHLQQIPKHLSPEVDEAVNNLDTMLQQAEHQAEIENRLVEALLDGARMEQHNFSLSLKRCNLVTIVQEVVSSQQRIARTRDVKMLFSQENAVPIIADADRIGQVLINYLTNAFKYSPADLPVFVGLEIVEQTARVFVRDLGPGLTEEQQQHIWERFYRAETVVNREAEREGLGLGLYIARIIIEQHQGQVGVESSPGKGSTFWFSLPLASAIADSNAL